MTNPFVQIILCLVAWMVVLVRLSAIRWNDIREGNRITLRMWLMMFFTAIGITSMMDFATILDTYTINNLSRLIADSSFLIAINIGLVETANVIGKPVIKPFIRWVWLLLAITLSIAGIIYIFYIWHLPEFGYYTIVTSLPEALFKLVIYSFETTQCIFASKILMDYLPSETSTPMRIRLIIMVISCLALAGSTLIAAITAIGYFWYLPILPELLGTSPILAVSGVILHLLAFMSNRIYVKFTLLTEGVQHWYAFQDLQYLIQRMIKIFPIIGLPPGKPNFIQFVLEPEHYLYPALILILDGRAMLDDFLAEVGDPPPKPESWEIEESNDLIGEALEIHSVMQVVHPPDDFYDMIEAYRHVSRKLFLDHNF